VSSTAKRILIDILRHGEPEGGDILRGRIDPVLTRLGWQQMRRATALVDVDSKSTLTPNWTHIISSPLQRCRQFAEEISQHTKTDLQVNDQWQEIDYGDWDGMLLSEWRKEAADQFKEFRKDLSKLAPPNGEDYLSFKDRILTAWQEISELEGGSHVLLVTHGGVMRVILPTILGMPLNRSSPLIIPFACFSRVSLEVKETTLSASLQFHNAAEYESRALTI
jgi:broad specificity phosphatase PhoE